MSTRHDPRVPRRDRGRASWLAPLLLVVVSLALVIPALPGLPWTLGAEDVLFFRPPFTGLKPVDLLIPSNALLADPVEVFHPDLGWTRSSLLDGTAPIWNPFAGGGWPVIHSQQAATLYPLNWLALALPVQHASGLIAALHVLLAAGGTYVFARRSLELVRPAAAMAGLAFGCSSYIVSWLEHPHDNVYVLLPFALLAIDTVIVKTRARDAAALAAVVGLALLGGHPQSVVLIAVPVLVFAVWRWLGGARRARSLLLAAAGVLGGLLAGAAAIVPFAEILGHATSLSRGGLDGLEPRTLLSAFLPDRWGRPEWIYQDPTLRGQHNYLERTIYVGAPALMLAAGGLAARRSAPQLVFAGCAAAGVAMAIELPLSSWFVENVPPFSNVTMSRASVITTFSLAVLAGYGLQRWLEGDARVRRRVVVGAAVVAALPVLWLVVSDGVAASLDDAITGIDDDATAITDSARAGAAAVLRWIVVAAAALLLLVVGRRPRHAMAAAALLLTLLAVDLIEQNRGLHPVVETDRAEVEAVPAITAARTAAGTGRVIGEGSFLSPNLGTPFELRDARIREQPHLRRYWNLWLGLSRNATSPLTFSVAAQGSDRVMDAFGVRALMAAAGTPPPPLRQLAPAYQGPDGSVYINRTALPRAYVTTRWRIAAGEDEGLAATLASSTAQLRAAPVVEGATAPAAGGGAKGTADIRVDGANRVEVAVDSPRSGRLVLLDSYFPGWRATVDGKRVPIDATNAAFRSVSVPAGKSTVVFAYRPASVAVGGLVSLLAWIVIAVLLIAGWRTAVSRPTTPSAASAPPPR